MVVALATSASAHGSSHESAHTTTSANLVCASKTVATWSLTRVARETVVVSAQATSLASLTSAAAQGYGGFLLFGASAPSALVPTLASLRRLEPDRLVPMVMTDDEGGGIIRFPNLVGQWPWAQVMGSTMSTAQILAQGQKVGAAMARVGLNVDLAPVADVDGRAVWPGESNPDGLRSFGGSPAKDALDVTAFATGLGRSHVLAVVKHFPGLGGTSPDTDYGPASTKSWAVLQSTGLLPFRAAIASGVGAIMMSNATDARGGRGLGGRRRPGPLEQSGLGGPRPTDRVTADRGHRRGGAARCPHPSDLGAGRLAGSRFHQYAFVRGVTLQVVRGDLVLVATKSTQLLLESSHLLT
jgi:beta-N-acetylhexosaminidase